MQSRTYVALALAALAFGFSASAVGDESAASRPFLLGGDAPAFAHHANIDPRLPRGETRLESKTPLGPTVSSARFNIQIQGGSPSERRLALSLLEEAREQVWLSAGELLSGAGSLLWVLDKTQPSPEVQRRAAPTLHFDQASAICRGGALNASSALECAAAAAALRRSPSAAQPLLGGLARAALIELHGPRAEDASWLTQLDGAPEAPLLTRLPAPGHVEGSALFFGYLAEQGTGSALETGLLALGLTATQTPPRALRYLAEPDLLDVVRHSVGNSREAFARFFSTLAEERFLGQSGRLAGGLTSPPARLGWEVPSSSLPRHLVLPRELSPTGSVALKLDTRGQSAEVAFRIYCEKPVSSVWTLLRLGEQGELLGRVAVPFQESASHLAQRIHPAGARALLLVGTNLGGVDLEHPYDLDHAPHETHLCSVALSLMPGESARALP